MVDIIFIRIEIVNGRSDRRRGLRGERCARTHLEKSFDFGPRLLDAGYGQPTVLIVHAWWLQTEQKHYYIITVV